MREKLIAGLGILLILSLAAGGSAKSEFDRTLDQAVEKHRFGLARWEVRTLASWLGQSIWSGGQPSQDGIETIVRYTEMGDRIRTLAAGAGDEKSVRSDKETLEQEQVILARAVELIMERQIRAALSDEGIYHPWYTPIGLKAGFPPVNFELQKPPHLLVVSSRDRIETMKTVLLKSELDVSSMESIEARTDTANVSSLVVNLGGFGTFPAIVSGDADLQYVVETAAHEWVHEYLAFRPLGFRYLLHTAGIRRDPDIVAINETVANIVGKEIGAAIMERYYSGSERTAPPAARPGAFDFDLEVQEIRKTVDGYLAKGEINEAEEFMRQKRDYLAKQGYRIRKLNQAYFAFHGQYADVPAFVSPIGTELAQLRENSVSLAGFLNVASSITGRDDLKNMVAGRR